MPAQTVSVGASVAQFPQGSIQAKAVEVIAASGEWTALAVIADQVEQDCDVVSWLLSAAAKAGLMQMRKSNGRLEFALCDTGEEKARAAPDEITIPFRGFPLLADVVALGAEIVDGKKLPKAVRPKNSVEAASHAIFSTRKGAVSIRKGSQCIVLHPREIAELVNLVRANEQAAAA